MKLPGGSLIKRVKRHLPIYARRARKLAVAQKVFTARVANRPVSTDQSAVAKTILNKRNVWTIYAAYEGAVCREEETSCS